MIISSSGHCLVLQQRQKHLESDEIKKGFFIFLARFSLCATGSETVRLGLICCSTCPLRSHRRPIYCCTSGQQVDTNGWTRCLHPHQSRFAAVKLKIDGPAVSQFALISSGCVPAVSRLDPTNFVSKRDRISGFALMCILRAEPRDDFALSLYFH